MFLFAGNAMADGVMDFTEYQTTDGNVRVSFAGAAIDYMETYGLVFNYSFEESYLLVETLDGSDIIMVTLNHSVNDSEGVSSEPEGLHNGNAKATWEGRSKTVKFNTGYPVQVAYSSIEVKTDAGTATGVNTVLAADSNAAYTLDGKRVDSMAKAGLYVQNGRKVIVK